MEINETTDSSMECFKGYGEPRGRVSPGLTHGDDGTCVQPKKRLCTGIGFSISDHSLSGVCAAVEERTLTTQKKTHVAKNEEISALVEEEEVCVGENKKSLEAEVQAQGLNVKKSMFRGVRWDTIVQKWAAAIHIDGPLNDEEAAAQMFDAHAVNFPSEGQEQVRMEATSKSCRGGTWAKADQEWRCQSIFDRNDGKYKLLGYFDDEETAARKYDEHAALLGLLLNYPPEGQAQKKMDKSSKFRGVSWHNQAQKWKAQIQIDGKTTYLGTFDDEETAARKYDEHAPRLGRPLNFPSSDIIAKPKPKVVKTTSSKFRGVSWFKPTQKWRAQITIDGKRTYLGHFNYEETAARKYDEHAARLGRPLNVPSSESRAEPIQEVTKTISSKFRGVSWHKQSQKWRARIRIDGKRTELGYFVDEETAARKYDEHAACLGQPLNFSPKGSTQVANGTFQGDSMWI